MMQNHEYLEQLLLVRHKELQAEAAQYRLAREAQAARTQRRRLRPIIVALIAALPHR